MSLVILFDIGSTYTKTTAVDTELVSVVGKDTTPTTVQDLTIGLNQTLSNLAQQLGAEAVGSARKLACSSAAGGLKMVAIGLVPDLTAEAAKQASLGGGARVLKTYSYQLTDEDAREIETLKPDIILLAGGTDGGNQDNILTNAGILSTLELGIPVIIAGNRNAAAQVAAILARSFATYITNNVMPAIGKLDVEPARQVIRQVFLEKIVYAKGFSNVSKIIEGIVMPTPAAVLKAGHLLSTGVGEEKGWGELLVVDVGGATTDIHSFCSGKPTQTNVVLRGLPEPYSKRTVEGDLGVRISARSLVDLVGHDHLVQMSNGLSADFESFLEKVTNSPEYIGDSAADHCFDASLGSVATMIATGRHVGQLTQAFSPTGPIWIQEGKDLTNLAKVVCTGGVFVNSKDPLTMAKGVISRGDPTELRPVSPEFFLDQSYILAAVGLLSESQPRIGLQILKKSLKSIS